MMPLDLPVIEAGLIIGEFELDQKNIYPNSDHPVKFTCMMTGDCCSALRIPVTDFDIYRIESHGYELLQIIDDLNPELKLPKENFIGVEKYYWMKRKEYDETCRFLVGNKCSIHEFKPFGCRVFPFSFKHLTRDLVQVRVHPSNFCKKIKTGNPRGNYSILNQLRNIYLDELKFRGNYFERHGRDI